jgi:hypothetical protein
MILDWFISIFLQQPRYLNIKKDYQQMNPTICVRSSWKSLMMESWYSNFNSSINYCSSR